MELVSIITPMYNGRRFIAYTIESVQAQSYENWEMIIVDDNSPDNDAGLEIAEGYAKEDNRINVIALNKNQGSSGARNVGIKNAKGRYFCFLDSDDIWHENFLKSQVKFMKENSASLVYSSYDMITESGKKIKTVSVKKKVTYHELLKTNWIAMLTSMYDSKVLGIYFFDTELHSLRDDLEFWLRIIKKAKFAHGNSEVLASYRVVEDSVTHNKLKMIKPQWKIYRKIEKLNILKASYYFLWWAWRGFKKFYLPW